MANAATTVRITLRIFGIDQYNCLCNVFNLSSIVINILHLFWLIFVDVFDHSPVEFGNCKTMGSGASSKLANRLARDYKDKFGDVNVLHETPVSPHSSMLWVKSCKQHFLVRKTPNTRLCHYL